MRLINLIDKKQLNVILLSLCFLILCSCEEFLDNVDVDKSKVNSDLVFSNDITATSAVNGIYVDMLNPQNFSSGSSQSIVAIAGLSADEFDSYSSNVAPLQFAQNSLLSDNSWILSLWISMYKIIYEANSVIDGVKSSSSMTEATKKQLEGEATFIRAFCHFYLTNLFGDIPLVITTDYKKNALITRTAVNAVYEQIIKDLELAQANLQDDYIATERARPNKSTATALLARVYLYQKKWDKAEDQSSGVINNEKYSLVELNEVFQQNSMEAIWQLKPVIATINTIEGYYFILTSSPVNNPVSSNAVTSQLTGDFETGDQRKSAWLNSYSDGTTTWYYPYKYKIKVGSSQTEYSMVFRLAEQYLIRAEARANQENLSGAIADVDSIRYRAGLPLIKDTNPGISKDDLLLAIEHERRIELFAEWGHRWFDLKRTNRADGVLDLIKSNWNSEDLLYPIPLAERNKNPKLGDQNPGYN